jgi:hypothetical protein
MKKLLFLLILLCTKQVLLSQYVYTIKADSVKITNTCDTAELIIENHTQNVLGFLFNKGKGRTEFRRAIKLDDSTLVFGGDTLVIRGSGATTASNGLSLLGNNVQLGQYPGEQGNPAALLTEREIPMNGNIIVFSNDVQSTILSGGGLQITGAYTGMLPPGPTGNLTFVNSTNESYAFTSFTRYDDRLEISLNSTSPGAIRLLDNGHFIYGNSGVNVPNVDFGIYGRASFLNPVTVSTENLIVGGITGNHIYTNEGATGTINFTFAASSIGCTMTFIVMANQTINISGSGEKIRIGANNTGVGDAISSSTIGNSVTIVKVSNDQWVATQYVGTWNF